MKKRIASSLGKYGIKGSTGLGVEGFFHLSAPYDSNGKVFVQYTYRRSYVKDGEKLVEEMDSWKRMTLAKAKKEKRTIIPCSMCDKPAVSLDHHWPYENLFNRCKKHYGANVEEWLKQNPEPDPPEGWPKLDLEPSTEKGKISQLPSH